MAENKTQKTKASVSKFLNSIEHEKRRADGMELLKIFEKATEEKPEMWGPSIIGFGDYHYKYDSGREGDFFLAGFSPRKQNLSLYIMAGFNNYPKLMSRLGKYKKGAACIYVNKLEDINRDVLIQLVKESADHLRKTDSH